MPKTATALSGLLVLCVLVLAACGGSSGSSGTKTATLPGGNLGQAAATPRIGYYAGMECTDHACTHFTAGPGRNHALASCKAGRPVPGRPATYRYNGRDEYLLCFQLQSPTALVSFFASGEEIVRRAHVQKDAFPQQCENGWCITGRWTAPPRLSGTIRNPNGLTTQYAAEWVGMP